MLRHVDPASRPTESRSVTFSSSVVHWAVFFLRNHAVTLRGAAGKNVAVVGTFLKL